MARGIVKGGLNDINGKRWATGVSTGATDPFITGLTFTPSTVIWWEDISGAGVWNPALSNYPAFVTTTSLGYASRTVEIFANNNGVAFEGGFYNTAWTLTRRALNWIAIE